LEKEYNENASTLAEKLLGNPLTGQLKQWVNWLTLRERAKYPGLFLSGSYIPLKVIGKYHKRVIAYYRRYNDQHLIVILPLSTATLEGDSLWEDTQIRLPETAPSDLVNILTAEVIDAGKILHLEEVFDVVPFALLRNSSD
jgi:(1->4)-alpha-D-glucan 1-alpha-D-glucosylmutase